MTLLTPMNALRLAMTENFSLQSQRNEMVRSKNTAQSETDASTAKTENASDEWWFEFN